MEMLICPDLITASTELSLCFIKLFKYLDFFKKKKKSNLFQCSEEQMHATSSNQNKPELAYTLFIDSTTIYGVLLK